MGAFVLDGFEPWVQRLTDAVGFRAVRQELNWPNAEAVLGIELPKDDKELVEVFGGGVISQRQSSAQRNQAILTTWSDCGIVSRPRTGKTFGLGRDVSRMSSIGLIRLACSNGVQALPMTATTGLLTRSEPNSGRYRHYRPTCRPYISST